MLFGPSENCAAAAETLKKGLMEFDKEIQKRGDFFGGETMNTYIYTSSKIFLLTYNKFKH